MPTSAIVLSTTDESVIVEDIQNNQTTGIRNGLQNEQLKQYQAMQAPDILCNTFLTIKLCNMSFDQRQTSTALVTHSYILSDGTFLHA